MTEKNFMERIIELHSELGEMKRLRTEFQFYKNRKEAGGEYDFQEKYEYRST